MLTDTMLNYYLHVHCTIQVKLINVLVFTECWSCVAMWRTELRENVRSLLWNTLHSYHAGKYLGHWTLSFALLWYHTCTCVLYRVTQTYDAGACVYFYLAFCYTGVSDPMQAFHDVEVSSFNHLLISLSQSPSSLSCSAVPPKRPELGGIERRLWRFQAVNHCWY